MTPSASPSGLGSLPLPRAALVDRDRDVAAVRAVVLREDVPLVTLTGPGGVGKTRLALAVAQSVVVDQLLASGVDNEVRRRHAPTS